LENKAFKNDKNHNNKGTDALFLRKSATRLCLARPYCDFSDNSPLISDKFINGDTFLEKMRILTLEMLSPEDQCVDLNGPNMDPTAYPGQDSVVFRDNQINKAVHVYQNHIAYEQILKYAQHVNIAKASFEKHPFIEKIEFEKKSYDVIVGINPVEEVGEKLFEMQGNRTRRAYTLSPFIEGSSLCWPNQANNDEQFAVAKCFDMLFYDRIDNALYSQTNINGIDINPVNVKYAIDKDQQKISLTITDLAKNIGDVGLDFKNIDFLFGIKKG